MPYVYRYIDLESEKVVYIGKVIGAKDVGYDPLRNRHEQHCREEWYKKNEDNLIMQFIEVKTHTDADILETYLINFYDNGQLINKAKTGWGKCSIDLYTVIAGNWRTYGRGCNQTSDAAREALETLYRTTEGIRYNVDTALNIFCGAIKNIEREHDKVDRLSRYDEQMLFL